MSVYDLKSILKVIVVVRKCGVSALPHEPLVFAETSAGPVHESSLHCLRVAHTTLPLQEAQLL